MFEYQVLRNFLYGFKLVPHVYVLLCRHNFDDLQGKATNKDSYFKDAIFKWFISTWVVAALHNFFLKFRFDNHYYVMLFALLKFPMIKNILIIYKKGFKTSNVIPSAANILGRNHSLTKRKIGSLLLGIVNPA